MAYSSFSILALILHLIINYDILVKRRKEDLSVPALRYREYLLCISVYYITDMMWGLLMEIHIIPLVYADTFIYFASMVLSVLLWTRYLIAYIGRIGRRSNSLLYAVWAIFIIAAISLLVNLFYPVIFSFGPNGEYIPGSARYFIFGIQFLLFLILALYSMFVALRSEGDDRIHYRTAGASAAVLAFFNLFQILYPLVPYYAIGSIIATSLIHVFVEEDENIARDRILQDVIRKAEKEQKKTEKARKEREDYNNIAASLSENYDAIYYIDIETGRYREFSASRLYESMNVPKHNEDFFRETQDNARRYAHPDDVEFAVSLYDKDTMLRNLEGRRSYSYKYRIMVNGEPRYFSFTVMIAQDKKHLVLCDKDINDEITAENMLRENQKMHMTFSQLAESLAYNYDVIYYVNAAKGNYVVYTARNIYGQLVADASGDDFSEIFATTLSGSSILRTVTV